MQYSMTFIRLVNGVADSAQKGKVASSVANLAGYAGESWPAMFQCCLLSEAQEDCGNAHSLYKPIAQLNDQIPDDLLG